MEKLKVLMVGGKRCGKTTVLTSMWKKSATTMVGTNLTMNVANNVFTQLQETYFLSQSYFEDADRQSFIKVSDDNRGPDINSYEFKIQLKNKNLGLVVEFTDVPGEYFEQPGHYEEAVRLIDESQVLLIAIDTPCLMEEKTEKGYGEKRHSILNKSDRIINFIKNMKVESIKNRMVLFVPIKCEKYYYEGRMEELAKTVEAGYADLIKFLGSNNLANNCTVATLPMISLGGLEFFQFTDENLDKSQPTNAEEFIYRQNDAECKYAPKYCDQPFLYTLAFFFKILQTNKWRDSVFAHLASFFGRPDNKALMEEFAILGKRINKKEDEGFVILQNPMGI